MKRRLIVLALLSLVCAAPAAAQGAFTVLDSRHAIDFGQRIAFSLEARAPAVIDRVELIFQENGAPAGVTVPAAFEPGRQVSAVATIDLSAVAVTPFARGYYFWRVADRSGAEYRTDPTPIQYDDNRFEWELRSRGNVNVYAYDRPVAQMEEALTVAVAAQARITQQLGTPMLAVIDIYIYNAVDDMRTALVLHGRDAIEGYADPRHNVILISPSRAFPLLDLQRQVPHELAHLYIGLVDTGANAPAWFVEGLALFFEAEPDPDLRALFDANMAGGALYTLEALCAAFPLDRTAFALAYAQSYEVVRYIENRHGPAGVRALLDAYGQGATCEGGVAQALGVSLRTLEGDWLRSVTKEEALPPPPSQSGLLSWIALLAIFALWPALFLTVGRPRAGASS